MVEDDIDFFRVLHTSYAEVWQVLNPHPVVLKHKTMSVLSPLQFIKWISNKKYDLNESISSESKLYLIAAAKVNKVPGETNQLT